MKKQYIHRSRIILLIKVHSLSLSLFLFLFATIQALLMY
jgi:hypothetical protein